MKGTNVKIGTVIATLILSAISLPSLAGPEETKQARAVFEKNKDAVVWVTANANFEISAGGQSQNKEMKLQAMGTIIDPCGMVVVPLGIIDPGAMADGKVGPGGMKMSIKTMHTDIKIVLPPSKANPNGLEVAARIALKDTDLNLAFVLPDEKAKDKPAAFTCVKLDKAPAMQELEPLVCLGRMAKAMDQTPTVSTSELTAIIRKPRTFYTGGQYQGGPVFTLTGALVGITTIYTTESGSGQTPVILPAEDVQELAQQAKTAKPAPASAPAATTSAAPK